VKIANGSVDSRSPFTGKARNELLADLKAGGMKLMLKGWTKEDPLAAPAVEAKSETNDEALAREIKEAQEMVKAIDAQLPAEYHDDNENDCPF
jgi:hypothetical protein